MLIKSIPVNAEQGSADIGLIPKIGGLAIGANPISADVTLPEIAYLFRVGDSITGKTLVLEGADSTPVAFVNLAPGEEIVFLTKKILYQALITSANGEEATYTTNVTLLTWAGGQ